MKISFPASNPRVERVISRPADYSTSPTPYRKPFCLEFTGAGETPPRARALKGALLKKRPLENPPQNFLLSQCRINDAALLARVISSQSQSFRFHVISSYHHCVRHPGVVLLLLFFAIMYVIPAPLFSSSRRHYFVIPG